MVKLFGAPTMGPTVLHDNSPKLQQQQELEHLRQLKFQWIIYIVVCRTIDIYCLDTHRQKKTIVPMSFPFPPWNLRIQQYLRGFKNKYLPYIKFYRSDVRCQTYPYAIHGFS